MQLHRHSILRLRQPVFVELLGRSGITCVINNSESAAHLASTGSPQRLRAYIASIIQHPSAQLTHISSSVSFQAHRAIPQMWNLSMLWGVRVTLRLVYSWPLMRAFQLPEASCISSMRFPTSPPPRKCHFVAYFVVPGSSAKWTVATGSHLAKSVTT